MASFEYVRHVDRSRLDADPAARVSLKLHAPASGARNVSVSCIRTPPGQGSPEGLHTHPFEQVFFVLEGEMTVEVAGERTVVGPESLVVFPPGVPHGNWNAGTRPTLHLAINAPPAAPR